MKTKEIRRRAVSPLVLDLASMLLVSAVIAAVAVASGDLKLADTGLDRLVASLSVPAEE